MRKCHSCGATKGLKAIVIPDCDEPNHSSLGGYHRSSICKSCYFETASCDEDFHQVDECLESPSCPNHKDSKLRLEHWNELDYDYKPKKHLLVTVNPN